MSLVERTNEMFQEIHEVMDSCMKTVGIEDIMDIDDESMLAFKKTINLMKKSEAYSLEMAAKLDKIDRIEKKLDLLLENR